MENPENPLSGRRWRRGARFGLLVFVQPTKNEKTCQDPLQGQKKKTYG
jgi:hypothetical protein